MLSDFGSQRGGTVSPLEAVVSLWHGRWVIEYLSLLSYLSIPLLPYFLRQGLSLNLEVQGSSYLCFPNTKILGTCTELLISWYECWNFEFWPPGLPSANSPACVSVCLLFSWLVGLVVVVVCFVLVKDSCSPGWPWTHYVPEDNLEFVILLSLGLQVCTTISTFMWGWDLNSEIHGFQASTLQTELHSESVIYRNCLFLFCLPSGNRMKEEEGGRLKKRDREPSGAVGALSKETIITELWKIRDKGGQVIFRIIHVGICSLFPSTQTEQNMGHAEKQLPLELTGGQCSLEDKACKIPWHLLFLQR